MDEMIRIASRNKWRSEYLALLSKIEGGLKSRLAAHLNYLDEYFLRWLGFCRLEFADPAELMDNGLFFIIEAVSEVAADDIQRLSDALVINAWDEYQDCLRSLRNDELTMKTKAEQCFLKLRIVKSLFEQSG